MKLTNGKLTPIAHRYILGLRVDATSYEDATQRVLAWAQAGESCYVCAIGCPRQEFWMAAHKDRIPAVMLGVGAAFDIHSGRVKQAPSWMQKSGLEWLFRLFMEPKRLWKRYFKHNPRFVLFFLMQWIASRFGWSLFRIQGKDLH